MECLNSKCNGHNINGTCRHNDKECKIRVTKTQNYVEEQLNHAIEKEEYTKQHSCFNGECPENDKTGVCTRKDNHLCMDKIEEPPVLNYEEEYYKLKKENEENKLSAKEFQRRLDEGIKEREKYIKKNEELEKENKELKEAIQEGIECVKECRKALESKNKSIESFGELAAKDSETIEKLNTVIESQGERISKYQDDILERQTQIEELKELKKLNNQGYMEQMNITLIEVQKENEKLRERTTTIKNYEAENNALRCRFEEAKQRIKMLEDKAEETKEKLENYKLLKRMMKVLLKGL